MDLASSVLQTIREATDEEYEDALARDAARSMAKAAMEDIYGDAAPEASRNLVTIIVKPKEAGSDDDIMMPHESRNHESRCIHSPLGSTRNLGKMRVANNPPNLLHDIFGLPRRSKPGLLHRNLLDLDSGFGASNVNEQVMRVENDRVPLKESNLRMGSNNYDNKETNLKLPSIHDKLKDLISGRSSLDDVIKTPLPTLPKLKPITPKLNINSDNTDLSSSPSNVKEEVGKISSHFENILPKTRPLDLKNLLKLKDVELVPLKDLIKAKNKPTLQLPSRITNEEPSSEANESEVKDLLNLVPRVRTVELSDAEVSPTNVIQQVIDDNCDNNARDTNPESNIAESEEKESSEFFNTTPSSELAESNVNERSTEINDSQSGESVSSHNDCDLGTMPATESDLPTPKESDLNQDLQDVENGDSGSVEEPSSNELVGGQEESVDSSQDNCLDGKSDSDSITGASNTVSNIVEPDSTTDDFVDEPVARQSQDGNNGINSLDDVKPKLIDPLNLDRTFNTIKKNIIEKIESLKIPKPKPRISNLFSKESLEDESQNPDAKNEESVQITSVKPENKVGTDSSEIVGDSGTQVSMQDLQEMSDSMLQHENKDKPRSNVECKVTIEETVEQKATTEMERAEMQDSVEEKIPDAQNDDDMNTQSSNNSDNVKDTCGSDLQQQPEAQEQDTNVGASETVISKIPPRNSVKTIQLSDIVQPCGDGILQSPLPDLNNVLKLSPMPTLEDIKTTVTNLFDKGERNAENILPLKTVPLALDPAKILEPLMATDASSRNSHTKPAPERFLDDLNILKLQPPSLLSSPKLSDDFGFKPINFQPSFDNIGLGSATGRSSSKIRNPLDSLKLGDIGARSNFSPHNILKSPLRHDDLLNGRALSDLSQNINSHFKKASRNMHNMLGSTFNGAKIASPIQLEPHELLETISRNHEDVSDKLKAIHMDFNDRIETMRNDLLDKSRLLSSDSLNRKPSFKSSRDQHQSLLRSSQPKATTRKNTSSRGPELKSNNKVSSPSSRTKQFKMPTAASVPVPKTLNVPELKTMSKPGLVPQRVASPNAPKIELPRPNFNTFRSQGSNTKPFNKPLTKPINPFGDSKVKVSFSTTPRPRIDIGRPKPQEKIDLKSNLENRRIQSDARQTKLSTPTGLLNKHKPLLKNVENDKRISTPLRTPIPKLGNLENDGNVGSLLSWPKASESAFLSKVKEAVNARLPASGLPNRLQLEKTQPFVKSASARTRDDAMKGADMTRAASEVVQRTDGQPLKENVTYKCKMVCTKENNENLVPDHKKHK